MWKRILNTRKVRNTDFKNLEIDFKNLCFYVIKNRKIVILQGKDKCIYSHL